MSAYTKGPWHVGGITLPDTPGAHCSIWSATPPGYQSGDQVAQYVALHDAPLIAAAPDLYEALRKVCDCIVQLEGVPIEYALALEISRALRNGKDALAKAESRQS